MISQAVTCFQYNKIPVKNTNLDNVKFVIIASLCSHDLITPFSCSFNWKQITLQFYQLVSYNLYSLKLFRMPRRKWAQEGLTYKFKNNVY